MFNIESIENICDASMEADVTISDGEFSLICFSSHNKLNKESLSQKSLNVFSPSNIKLSKDKTYQVEKCPSNYYGYNMTMKLTNKEAGYLQLGKLKLEIEPGLLPKDLLNDSYIDMFIQRIDIY